jgi:hypothetical protein
MSEDQKETLVEKVEAEVRCCWHRVRIYGWAILIVLALWSLGGAFELRFNPKRYVDHILADLPYPASVGEAVWTDPQTLELRDVKFGDFFYADSIVLSARFRDLLKHHVDSVHINGGQLFMSHLNKELAKSVHASGKGLDWTIGKLILQRGTIMLDFGPDMPPIPVTIGAHRQVILNHLNLGTPSDSKPMTEEQMVELENIRFSSPFDPLAPVLGLPLVRIKFTYSELWHHQIRSIDLVRPNLYLGQDLFWFTDQMKKARAKEAKAGPQSPWQVDQFRIEYGRISVNTFGQPRLNFPFFFDTQVNDIRLDQLDKLTAKNVIAIRHFSRNYPEYKIKVTNLYGRLEFSVPPSDASANNVVPTVFIDQISWNNIPVTKAWAFATFDPTGIYAKMGGTCEKGLMDGNFDVYYTDGFKWTAGFFAHSIDCAPIAEQLAGKYGTLTGSINGKLAVNGQGTTIQRVNGTLTLDKPGALKIESADRLLNDLPANTVALKRDALKVILQAFSYYPYETGQFVVDYSPGNGGAKLKLNGPAGKRDFEVYWHPFGSSEVAKDADSH